MIQRLAPKPVRWQALQHGSADAADLLRRTTQAADAVIHGWNQYPPMPGLTELRQAVAAHYATHQDVTLDWEQEVMITSGATEAIAGALLALIRPGDEVILFQPMYDAYLPLVLRAGGVPRFVRLEPPHWRFDEAMLARAFTDKTRVVLLNNPLNPAASVMPRTMRRKCVSGSACESHCAGLGIASNGNMNPESNRDGRKKKKDICMACS